MNTVIARRPNGAARGEVSPTEFTAHGQSRATTGRTALLNRPLLLLRLEGAALCALALGFYGAHGGSWGLLALLFLAPDLSALGYLAGETLGAACYNAAHTTLLPLGIGALTLAGGPGWLLPLAAIWLAHIGFDRAIGYGLKWSGPGRRTHLSGPATSVATGAPAAR